MKLPFIAVGKTQKNKFANMGDTWNLCSIMINLIFQLDVQSAIFQLTVRCILEVKENWNRNINFRVIRVYMIVKTMRLNEIHKDISATITQKSKSSLQHSTVQRSERSKQYSQDSICINITLCMFICIFFFSKLYIPYFKFLNCCEKWQ